MNTGRHIPPPSDPRDSAGLNQPLAAGQCEESQPVLAQGQFPVTLTAIERIDADDALPHSEFSTPRERFIMSSTTGADLQQQALSSLAIVQRLESNYDLRGEITEIRALDGGVVNESFMVTLASPAGAERRLFVRQYAPGKKEEWVRFEHAVLEHLEACNITWTATLQSTKAGGTYVQYQDSAGNNRFMMVTSVIPGERRYSHENNNLSPSELDSVACGFAELHNAASTLHQPKYTPAFVPTEARMLRKFFSSRFAEIGEILNRLKDVDTPFLRLLRDRWADIQPRLARIPESLTESRYRQLPHIPIHHDLHPGNLLFQAQAISGIFDFDGARVDARIYDLALTLVFFCSDTSKDFSRTGSIQMDKVADFLHAYHLGSNFKLSDGIKGLSLNEARVLPEMMALGAAMLTHWFVNDYYQKYCSGGPAAIAQIEDEYCWCLALRSGTILSAFEHRDALLETTLALPLGSHDSFEQNMAQDVAAENSPLPMT